MNIEPLSNLGCAVLTCAKWCPLENCTILVIGKSALEEVKPLEVASFVITSIGIRLNFKSSFLMLAGCQFGIQLYDWDGSTMVHSFDFQENGIGVDGKLVTGGLVKGIKLHYSHNHST